MEYALHHYLTEAGNELGDPVVFKEIQGGGGLDLFLFR